MENCIFCQIASGQAKSWKVYETDYAYAFLDIHPVNEYHTLVIPIAGSQTVRGYFECVGYLRGASFGWRAPILTSPSSGAASRFRTLALLSPTSRSPLLQ